MKRFPALLLVAGIIGGVAGARVLLRDDGGPGPAPTQDQKASPSGRTVALDLAPLPPTLKREGDFVCAELRNANGTYTARAEGGSIRNVSGGPLTYGFVFDVTAGEQTETVQSRFRLDDGHGIPSITMASKSVQTEVTKCALRIVAVEAAPDAVAKVDAAAQAAGCSKVVRHESDGQDHIQPPEKGSYATKPPTSGNHYPAPSETGVHDRPIPDENQVHNLEHGHVGLQYRDVTESIRSALSDSVNDDPRWVFAAPYPSMSSRIVLTAWTVSLECANEPADIGAFTELVELFVATFRDQGRESIPGTPA